MRDTGIDRKYPVYVNNEPYTLFLTFYKNFNQYLFDFFKGNQEAYPATPDYHFYVNVKGNQAINLVETTKQFIVRIEDIILAEEREKQYWEEFENWDGKL